MCLHRCWLRPPWTTGKAPSCRQVSCHSCSTDYDCIHYVWCHHFLNPSMLCVYHFWIITDPRIQAVGGSVSASANDLTTNRIGSRVSRHTLWSCRLETDTKFVQIFLAGLIVQLISFITFTCLYIIFLYRVYTRKPDAWTMDESKPWYNDWRALGAALVISCIGIMVRKFSGHATFDHLSSIATFRSDLCFVLSSFRKDMKAESQQRNHISTLSIPCRSSLRWSYTLHFGRAVSSATQILPWHRKTRFPLDGNLLKNQTSQNLESNILTPYIF